MKRSLLLVACLLSACAVSMGPPSTKAENLQVSLFDANGTRAGTALLTSDSTGLDVVLDVAGLAPGVHTMRFHEHGICERPDFLSAGAVVADLKEIAVGPEGRGRFHLRYQRISGLFVPRVLIGGDGSALILGDSAGTVREACGILI